MQTTVDGSLLALGIAGIAFLVVPFYALCLRTLLAVRRVETLDEKIATHLDTTTGVTVLVPVFNERHQIRDKLRNLFEQEYPLSRLRVLIIDGGSTDGTPAAAQSLLEERGGIRFEILHSPVAGKIPQLNYALARIPRDSIVVITDADARLKTTRALRHAARLLSARGDIGVVGGYARPAIGAGMRLSEWIFWTMQNWIRELEGRVYSSNIAVAPFYAFRRDLIGFFPETCVADDVYVSFVAHTKRRRVVYSDRIPVVELRLPGSFSESLRHKMRKIHAYHLELFRFLRSWPAMRRSAAIGCAVRLGFFFGWPGGVIALGFAVPAIRELPPALGVFVLAYAFILLSRITRAYRADTGRKLSIPRGVFALGELFVLLVLASFAGIISLLVWKQGSIYWRVTGGEPSPV